MPKRRAESPLIGRDAELAELKEALASPGGLILISGEAGIGKTRLAREAARLAEAEGRAVVWARPEQVSKPGPYALLLDFVGAVIERIPSELVEVADALLRDLGGAHVAEAAQTLPTRAVATRVRGLISGLGERPVCVFEDIQSVDETSQAILVHVARAAGDDGFHILATCRAEEAYPDDPVARFLAVVASERLAVELQLKPLSTDDASRVLRSLNADLDDSAVGRMVSLAEGLPFFLEELSTSQGDDPRATPTITRVVQGRLARLSDVGRRAVIAGSLMFGPIDAAVLSRVLREDPSAVSQALVDATHTGLLHDRDGRLLFRHSIVREAIAASLVSVEAEDLHRLIAGAIEEEYPSSLTVRANILARHWYEARTVDKAGEYALTAGDRALGLGALPEARQAYELALTCTNGLDPRVRLGIAEVTVRMGEYERAKELLTSAATEFLRIGQPSRAVAALRRVAWLHAVRSETKEAIEYLNRGLDVLREHPDQLEEIRCSVQLGTVHAWRDEFEAGSRVLERAEILAKDQDQDILADVLDGLAWLQHQRGNWDEAERRGAAATSLVSGSSNPEVVGKITTNHAVRLTRHGKPSEALPFLAIARERVAHSFGTTGLSLIDFAEANANWLLGMPQAAERALIRCAHAPGASREVGNMIRAWCAVHLGEQARAEALVNQLWVAAGDNARARVIQDPTIDIPAASVACAVEAITAIERGIPTVADVIPVLRHWVRSGSGESTALSSSLLARVLLLLDRVEEASEAAHHLDVALSTFPSRYFRAVHLELSALTAGDATLLGQAAEAFSAMGNAIDTARCLRLSAQHAAPEQAKQDLRRARELAVMAGSSLETGRSEAALRERGVRPRAGRPRKDSLTQSGLSAREEEVVVLVAAGATNGEIAQRLFLSERTIQDHITNSLRKLRFSGRASLAAWAVKTGLV